MMSPRSLRRALRAGMTIAALAGALLASGAASAEDAAPASQPGVWQSHKVTFQFLGFSSTYSCDGLADKLRTLLLAAGARPDVKSQPGACASGFGRPDKFARADLTFYTLAPADGSSAKPVSGVWKPVAFAANSPRELQIGDCEVVEQFRDQVLSKFFTTRNLVNGVTCVPYQESGSTIDLKFEVLTAPPAKKPAGQ
jgi:hypothetical protein